jgi:DNA-binding Xre family transcriptional regulator
MGFYRTPSVVNVKEIMERKGMKEKDLAKAAGLSLKTIQACMGSDPYYPGVTERTVRRLCKALEVSKHEITCGEEEAQVIREIHNEERGR